MNHRVAGLLAATALLARAAAADPTPENRTLSDMNIPGEWRTHQWNKAQGRVSVRPEAPEGLASQGTSTNTGSLGMKINFVGGSPDAFEFFSVEPTTPQDPIPYRVMNASVWIKGSGTGQYIELHFLDATGQDVKVGVGQLNFTDWRKINAAIPSSWAQPLKFTSLTFHNWHMPDPAEITIYATRLEVTIDTSQKLASGASSAPAKTDDSW